MEGRGRAEEETRSVDDLLPSIIDETLKYVFKEAGTNVIYSYLGNEYHLKREEIADKPDVFSTGLKNLLGSGASVIEKMILKNLYGKLKLRFKEEGDCELSDHIIELRKVQSQLVFRSTINGGILHDEE